jgi:hypothetical protein
MAMADVPVQEFMSDPASTAGISTQVMVRVSVGFVPVHAPFPVAVSVAVKLPEDVLGVNVHCVGSVVLVLLQVPEPPPPVQAMAEKLPVAVDPDILMAAVPQLLSAAPAFTATAPQVITRVEVGFVPAQRPLPVTVNVAVNDPDDVDGVKLANAGFAFCDQDPRPPPPDQESPEYVPVAVAPVIVMAVVPVHVVISVPADAVGALVQLMTRVSVAVPAQAPPAVTVKVAVKEPLETDGVNTYAEGSSPLPDHEPSPAPPVQTGVPVAPPPVAPVMVMAPLPH